MFLQIEEYSRKQAELESKLNVANKRVCDLKLNACIKCRSGIYKKQKHCGRHMELQRRNRARVNECTFRAKQGGVGGVFGVYSGVYRTATADENVSETHVYYRLR